ncbi:MAG: TIGR04283 family arsenosugar biosynthesis glycosyltransferase [Bacteroidota bacterium]
MNSISIIIPTLNEAKHIEKLLRYLIVQKQSAIINEIIVVDGGSTDGTKELIGKIRSVRLISSERGRAKQLNLGAESAKGNILYFLHADSMPPLGFDQFIVSEIEKGQQAGCFRLKFDSDHWWLRLAGWFTQFNWKFCRGGDQSLFITKSLFENIGGYDESYPIYEDNILTEELFRRNSHVVINQPIKTSARMYKKRGIWKLQYHFWRIHFMHRIGATPQELCSYYRQHIAS